MIPQYILSLFVSVPMTLLSFPVSPVAALFLDDNNNLPRIVRWWLQPSDNPATGDLSWNKEHPYASRWWLATSYLWRNPSQGLDQLLAAKVHYSYICTKSGKRYNCGDYWEYRNSIHVGFGYLLISAGWRLRNIYERYEHRTQGQFIGLSIRWNKKGD